MQEHLTREKTAFLVKTATYASVTVATILIVVKLIAWWMTDSISLQATLIDSLLDALASLLNLVAVRHALRPADREHRFGHGKIEAIAALGQSVFIGISGGWLILEAIDRFLKPQVVEETAIGIGVMVIAIALTLVLIFYQDYVVKKTKSAAIKADSIHYRSDLLINLGVIVALLGVKWFNMPFLDPLIGTAIALYILYTAWTIVHGAFHMLIDREWPEEERDRIKKIAAAHPQVSGYHDLRTRTSGVYSFIQLHLEMDGEISLNEAHHIADEVTQMLTKEFPNTEILIHQDPAHLEEPHRDGFGED